MKRKFKYVALMLVTLNWACESGGDCFETNGAIVEEMIPVANFSRVLVNEDVELIVSQGDEHKVMVRTGENLLDDFVAEVNDGQLVLTMENTCELLRKHNTTKVYITAPNLTEIISSTQFEIRSEGILNYERLSLKSFTFSGDRWVVNGEFKMAVDAGYIDILGNEMANFEVRGIADSLRVRLTDGHVRVHMPDLVVGKAYIYHNSSLDITINPSEEVKGELRKTGDLVLKNVPPIVEVEELYKGKVIYD